MASLELHIADIGKQTCMLKKKKINTHTCLFSPFILLPVNISHHFNLCHFYAIYIERCYINNALTIFDALPLLDTPPRAPCMCSETIQQKKYLHDTVKSQGTKKHLIIHETFSVLLCIFTLRCG